MRAYRPNILGHYHTGTYQTAHHGSIAGHDYG